ncbi:MAG: CDP-glycerol glycerophosphotransferase family protein [Ruminiclostridium sp.]
MRKYQKDQILQLVSTLNNAHVEIKQQIEKRNFESAKELLTDCQQAAITIGTTIEKTEGEGLEVVSCIEDYCETLYQISINVEATNSNKEYKLLKNQMLRIESSIRNEINVKLEIVFLPYKASMWDSLESIWLTAEEDENCDCYVIPIPYYDLTPNRESGEMHCEGELLPGYVPITNYTDYDLRITKPDVIYFHNPYDQYNYVTSVHPAFYSSELKKYTNMLVYVPYFVSMGNVQEHLCNHIGIINAHKIIVQSEQVKKTYAKFVQADKVVVLGSPKIDKVIACNKHKPEIPEKWQEIIRGRKIVLYNTHLDALLNNEDKVLDKLRYVFSCFEDRNDVVLLWRPHPLSIETVSSMRPQLAEKYYELEQEYKDRQIGIFDNSADLHRAIAVSDAYFGDWSSLVPMYGLTGKPLLLQSLDAMNYLMKPTLNRLLFHSCIIEKDIIYFFAWNFNALVKYDIQNERCEILGVAPNEPLGGKLLFNGIMKIENRIFLAPSCSKNIKIFDLNTKEFRTIVLDEIHNMDEKSRVCGFSNIVKHKHKLYFIPSKYKAIVCLDYITDELTYFNGWYQELLKRNIEVNDILFKDNCIVDEILYLPLCISNIVLSFNMNTGESTFYEVGNKNNRYACIEFDGEDFWLLPRKAGAVVKWNAKKNITIEYSDYPSNFSHSDYDFVNMIQTNKELILFPAWCNMIIKLDKQSGEMVEYTNIRLENEEFCKGIFKYFYSQKYDEKESYVLSCEGTLTKLDSNGNVIYSKQILLSQNQRKQISKNIFAEEWENFEHITNGTHRVQLESATLSVSCYLDYIVLSDTISQKRANLYKSILGHSDGTVGKRIHQFIINNC